MEKKGIGCEIGGTSGEKPEENSKNSIQTDNVISADLTDIKQKAKEKLEKELKSAEDKNFANPIIGYLLKRCKEDEGLAQDVMQEHKTWQKCFDYIYSQARNQSQGNCAWICDDVVYEWAEDYYHKDDKVEEEKKAKEKREIKIKREKAKTEQKVIKPKLESNVMNNTEEKNTIFKPKKSNKDIDGQLDIFSLIGM